MSFYKVQRKSQIIQMLVLDRFLGNKKNLNYINFSEFYYPHIVSRISISSYFGISVGKQVRTIHSVNYLMKM